MEHFITEIKINKVRHLKDLTIFLSDTERKHLLLTGKNGSGKTSVLERIASYLIAVTDGEAYFTEDLTGLGGWANVGRFEEQSRREWIRQHLNDAIEVEGLRDAQLSQQYHKGDFITAYFPASRNNSMEKPTGVENVQLQSDYDINDNPSEIFLKYLVHLKAQQSFARNENDMAQAERISQWFDRFTAALRELLEDNSIELVYNYRKYQFQITQDGREPFGFDQLSDGYSSVIRILSDLILRMDKNWLLGDQISTYDVEGIVLIDEVETHLHIELQRKILPFLTTFFPRVQFIVSTHSPYVLNSISNAVIYDLERRVSVEDLSGYLAEDVAEGYFMAPSYSAQLKKQVDRYRELTLLPELTDEERVERIELKTALKRVSGTLAPEIAREFQQIEEERRGNGSV